MTYIEQLKGIRDIYQEIADLTNESIKLAEREGKGENIEEEFINLSAKLATKVSALRAMRQ